MHLFEVEAIRVCSLSGVLIFSTACTCLKLKLYECVLFRHVTHLSPPCGTLQSQLYCCCKVYVVISYSSFGFTDVTCGTVGSSTMPGTRHCLPGVTSRWQVVLVWHCQGGTHTQQCHFTHHRHCCHCLPCVTLGSQLYWCGTVRGGTHIQQCHFTHRRHCCHCLPSVTLGSQLYWCGTVGGGGGGGVHIHNNVTSHTTDTAVTVWPCDIRKPAVLVWHCRGGTHTQQCHFTHHRHCCHCLAVWH